MDRRDFLKVSGAAIMAGIPLPAVAATGLSDIEVLRGALALHPGLYRYSTPNEVEERLARFGRELSAAQTLEQRYLLLSRFLATIRCGHTYANFFNQKKPVAVALFDRPTRLPFHFLWIDGRMVVTQDASSTFAPGSEILRVNGRAAQTILNTLLPLVRSDGHNDAKRVSLLEVRGDESIETFDVFQGLVFPPISGVHRVEGRLPGGRRVNAELPAIGLAERRKSQVVSLDTESDQPLWTWDMRPDGVAVLTMPTWALYDSKWSWREWLEARLDSLVRARGLIIDLRTNEGGQDCGEPILARLIDRDFRPPAMQQRIRFRRTPRDLDPYLDTWDNNFRTLGIGARPLGNGVFERPGSSEISRVSPSSERIKVPVAVLVGPVNSSATFQFAQAMRATGAGRLYGQTTGGNRRGINGSCFFFVRLPVSGLEFDLPLVGQFPLVPQPDAGLEPDVRVVPTARDIAERRDRVMERAVADILRR